MAEHEHPDEVAAYLRSSLVAASGGLLLALASLAWLPGWLGATLAVGQGLVVTLVLIERNPSPWISNLVLFGLVAGFVELLADDWLVRDIATLVYPRGGPFLHASPLYMPFAWFGMLSGGLALALALRRRLSLGTTSLIVAVVLGLYIPFYELLALHARWWHYEHPQLLFDAVPPPIVLGELLLALPLAACAEQLRRAGPWTACGLGIAEGLWIALAYRVAWAVVG